VSSSVSLSGIVCGLIAAVLIGMVLFGAGGGGSASQHAAVPSSRAEGEARSTIEWLLTRTFTENDPAQCTQDMTPAFRRQSFGSEDGTDLEACRRDNVSENDTFAHSITLDNVSVHGDTANAVVRVSGGNGDGSVVTLHLVRDVGNWKLDRMTAVQIDRARFDGALRANALREGYTPREADCQVATLRRTYDTAALERALTQGHDAMAAARPALLSCVSSAKLAQEYRQGLMHGMSERIPMSVRTCIADTFMKGLSAKRLRAIVIAGSRSEVALERIRNAAIACGQAYRARDFGHVV
jgi:hypothetical protein